MARQQRGPLRRGWTTGACAAAAARAAFTALLSDRFPDPVSIRLPRGGTASFRLALAERECHDSIPGGERLAEKTMNTGLGIIGGLSILGTTGIVGPYSCSSWIHSIRRGIDVACAAGLDHIAASTGATSEQTVQRLYDLPDHALIDMGDFVGGRLKYLRAHPVARLTIAAGFAKLAGGHLALADSRERALARLVAARAREVALATMSGTAAVEVAIVDREGQFLARVGG
jgi:cobalt-precorrin-5B (C1)-methyltransferase